MSPQNVPEIFKQSEVGIDPGIRLHRTKFYQ